MKGIIIARNNRKSLMPLTEKVSRPMLNFFDRPLISCPIEQMKRAGIQDICVIATEDDTSLKEYLAQLSGVSYRKLPKQGITLQELAESQEACVLFNDITVTDFDLQKIFEAHQKGTPPITAVFPEPVNSEENAAASGTAEGIWFFRQSAYSFCIKGQTNLLAMFAKQNTAVQLLFEKGCYSQLSTVEEYLQCSAQLLEHPRFFEARREQNGVILSENTYLEVGAKIKPPVYIGENVSIRKNAEILPYSVICKNTVICESARVSRSVISQNCRIESDATITDSLLSEGVTVTKGATLPKGSVAGGNLRISASVPPKEASSPEDNKALSFGTHGILIPNENSHRFLYRLGQVCGTFYASGITGIFKDDSSKTQCFSHSFQAGLQSTGMPLYEFPACTLAMAKSACPFYRLKAGFYLYESGEQAALALLDENGNAISRQTEEALREEMHQTIDELRLPLQKSIRMKPYQLYYISEITRRLQAKTVSRKLFCETDSPLLQDYLQRVANAHKITLIRQPKAGVIRFRSNPSATEFTLCDETNRPLTKRQTETIIAALTVWEKEDAFITTVHTSRAICQYLKEHGVTPGKADNHPHNFAVALREMPEQYYLRTDPVYLVMKILIYLSEHNLTLAEWIASLPKSFLIEKTITLENHLAEAVSDLLKQTQDAEKEGESTYRFQSKKGITTITRKENDITILSESQREEYAEELTDFYVKQFTNKKTGI